MKQIRPSATNNCSRPRRGRSGVSPSALLRAVAPGYNIEIPIRQVSPGYYTGLAGLIIALALGGCIAMSNSPTPRFYALQAIDGNYTGEKFNIPSSVIIGIGPVKVPEYQNRPQIVTQDTNNLITFAQFDRWGENLDLALLRLIAADISVVLPGATLEISPWNLDIPVKYHVVMDVVRLESRLDKDLAFTVQWSVIDLENKKMMLTKKSEFSKPIEPHNYFGLAKTLSLECASLSGEIAGTLSSLIAQPGK